MDAVFAGRTAMALPTLTGLRRRLAFSPSSLAGLTFWHDPSDAGTVTLNGSGLSALAGKSSNAFVAQQSAASAQPDYLTGASGINGLAVAAFLAANNDQLNLSGGSDVCKAVPGFSFAGVVRIPALGAAHRVLTITTATGAARFAIGVSPSGQLQVITRRLDAESSSTGLSPAPVVAGSAHFVAGTVDYATGAILANVDAAAQTTTATWSTGAASDNTNSNVHPIYGRTGASTLTGDLGEICAYQRTLSTDEVTSLRSYFRSKWGLA